MTATITLPQLVSWVRRYSQTVTAERQYLTDLDAAIGDADHGSNMSRGMQAAVAKLDEATPETVGAFGKTVGMTLVSTVGGASGPLYGTLFLRFGAAEADATELDGPALAAALQAGVDGLIARGKAEAGDKTMLDALLPAIAALNAAITVGATLADAVAAAAEAAEAGREATIPLVAHKGRASYLGERSAGHIDPGAASSAMLMRALADELSGA